MYSMVYEYLNGWAEHFSWRVPIDRHTHVSFMIECIHKEGDTAEEFRKLRAQQREELKHLEPASSVTARILAGDLNIDDVEWRPDIVVIQDGAAMGGLDRTATPTMTSCGVPTARWLYSGASGGASSKRCPQASRPNNGASLAS